jgi:hypothetical protein
VPQLPDDRLHWTGRFADPAAERAYLQARLPAERAVARLLVLCILILGVSYAPLDLLFLGPTRLFAAVAGLRLGVSLWSLLCWRLLARADRPQRVGSGLLVWAGPLMAGHALILAVLPYSHIGSAAVFAVTVMLA